MRFEAIKPEIGRETPTVISQPRQEFSRTRFLPHFQGTGAGNANLDVVALLEVQGLHHRSRP